ncbi:hypothetical protein TREAZ_1105 [Leadbettera azotonutricia ZAS-9]|uniref:Uncharacterized protein n=1 Tax=Leadbettera azotonutricia (strain ATCC BAA-888 / DSM 13862 / ZAS-9) TaxID=545695 RepID=F5Y7H5_LEAAZ|nr:hypothetical protein TREAZ_1105 [Leadbettera azotonutricia ZAS-9]
MKKGNFCLPFIINSVNFFAFLYFFSKKYFRWDKKLLYYMYAIRARKAKGQTSCQQN